MTGDNRERGIEPWETLDDQFVYDCRVFELRKVRRRSPSSGSEGEFYYISALDWVNVVAVTDDERVVLIRQYRQGVDGIELEIPGGIVDEGESHADAARRELLEETGYECDEIIEIGRVRPNPAINNNWAYTLLALGAKPSGETSLDEHEEIDIEPTPLSEIDELLRSGAITHALVVDAFLWYRLYRERTKDQVRNTKDKRRKAKD